MIINEFDIANNSRRQVFCKTVVLKKETMYGTGVFM